MNYKQVGEDTYVLLALKRATICPVRKAECDLDHSHDLQQGLQASLEDVLKEGGRNFEGESAEEQKLLIHLAHSGRHELGVEVLVWGAI